MNSGWLGCGSMNNMVLDSVQLPVMFRMTPRHSMFYRPTVLHLALELCPLGRNNIFPGTWYYILGECSVYPHMGPRSFGWVALVHDLPLIQRRRLLWKCSLRIIYQSWLNSRNCILLSLLKQRVPCTLWAPVGSKTLAYSPKSVWSCQLTGNAFGRAGLWITLSRSIFEKSLLFQWIQNISRPFSSPSSAPVLCPNLSIPLKRMEISITPNTQSS